MTATILWAAVVESYEDEGLRSLTNPRDKGAAAINTTYGENAAQDVIDLWPMYAQVEWDETDTRHIAVGKQAVIAMLFRRGGSSAKIEQVKWDEVFGDDGLLTRLRRTSPRGRSVPSSNSGVSQRSELESGRAVRGWSDRDSLPPGILPRRTLADD